MGEIKKTYGAHVDFLRNLGANLIGEIWVRECECKVDRESCDKMLAILNAWVTRLGLTGTITLHQWRYYFYRDIKPNMVEFAGEYSPRTFPSEDAIKLMDAWEDSKKGPSEVEVESTPTLFDAVPAEPEKSPDVVPERFCKDCGFYIDSDASGGRCFERPPVVVADGVYIKFLRPLVKPTDFCGVVRHA